MNEISVTIKGPVGSGKTNLAFAIQDLCNMLGLTTVWNECKMEENLSNRKNYSGELRKLNPTIIINEVIDKPSESPKESIRPRLDNKEIKEVVVDFLQRFKEFESCAFVSTYHRDARLDISTSFTAGTFYAEIHSICVRGQLEFSDYEKLMEVSRKCREIVDKLSQKTPKISWERLKPW